MRDCSLPPGGADTGRPSGTIPPSILTTLTNWRVVRAISLPRINTQRVAIASRNRIEPAHTESVAAVRRLSTSQDGACLRGCESEHAPQLLGL